MKLKEIAYARSGDKGAHANIGLIARHPEGYEKLVSKVTEEAVKTHFASLKPTKVVRYLVPNLNALNFVLFDVLPGGGSMNLAIDAQGKALGQALLEMEVS